MVAVVWHIWGPVNEENVHFYFRLIKHTHKRPTTDPLDKLELHLKPPPFSRVLGCCSPAAVLISHPAAFAGWQWMSRWSVTAAGADRSCSKINFGHLILRANSLLLNLVLHFSKAIIKQQKCSCGPHSSSNNKISAKPFGHLWLCRAVSTFLAAIKTSNFPSAADNCALVNPDHGEIASMFNVEGTENWSLEWLLMDEWMNS